MSIGSMILGGITPLLHFICNIFIVLGRFWGHFRGFEGPLEVIFQHFFGQLYHPMPKLLAYYQNVSLDYSKIGYYRKISAFSFKEIVCTLGIFDLVRKISAFLRVALVPPTNFFIR